MSSDISVKKTHDQFRSMRQKRYRTNLGRLTNEEIPSSRTRTFHTTRPWFKTYFVKQLNYVNLSLCLFVEHISWNMQDTKRVCWRTNSRFTLNDRGHGVMRQKSRVMSDLVRSALLFHAILIWYQGLHHRVSSTELSYPFLKLGKCSVVT
jgi:hypothetical protein